MTKTGGLFSFMKMKSHAAGMSLETMSALNQSVPRSPSLRPRVLIVEDDFASRRLLQRLLSRVGECDIAVDGHEGVLAFQEALNAGQPYHLVCLDIMMPKLNGQDVLKQMRDLESQRGVLSSQGSKIIMITALGDMKNVMSAYHSLCDGYIAKPITSGDLSGVLRELKFIESDAA